MVVECWDRSMLDGHGVLGQVYAGWSWSTGTGLCWMVVEYWDRSMLDGRGVLEQFFQPPAQLTFSVFETEQPSQGPVAHKS